MNATTTQPRPARAQALARQDAAIDSNIATIERAKRPTALEAMAARLNVSAGSLTNTLKATVFKGAKDEEFVALVIVANAYGLNPLTKEIYAFPAKGGGIVPVVSIDGWLRIMNEHPQFDGIEFEDVASEDGKLMAIEATIYRKDRTRPIKVIEYLSECKGNTEPWKNMPARMLRHKATIQCARYAFGFSGIVTEDEVPAGEEMRIVSSSAPMPSRNASRIEDKREPVEQEVVHDEQTGEVLDDDLDAAASDASEQDARGMTIDPRETIADDLVKRFGKVETVIDLNNLSTEYGTHRDAMPDELVAAIDEAEENARQRLAPEGK